MTETILHSDCSPSSLKRRIECPGSRNAERGRPDRTSIYAAEGSVFHDVIAMCLEFGLEADDFLDREFVVDNYRFTFDETFARHARPALIRVREMLVDCDHVFIEQRVDISGFTEPGQFGTLDVGGVNLRRRIIRLHDWKYGEGVGVEAEGNWQIIAYVLGLWDTFLWKMLGTMTDVKVEIIVDSPRRPEQQQQWETTLTHLMTYVPTILDAIKRTNDPDAPRHAGLEWCFFCKARGSCAELARFNMQTAALKFEEMAAEVPAAGDLTDEQVAAIIRNAPLWSVWLRGVHEYALQQVLQGQGPVKFLKAVPGRAGHRYWTDEDKAERELVKRLGRDAFQMKLVSPAKAEAKLGKKQASDLSVLWDQRETKPSLVPIEDARDPILPWSAAFEDNSEEENAG